MALFTGPSAAPSGLKPCFFCMSSGISSRRMRLDLPLRRAVPHRVRAPDHLVLAEPLDQRAQHGRGESRMRDRGIGEAGAELGMHVLHAELLRNLRQVGHPVDAAGVLELLQRSVRQFDEGPQRGVIDDERDLRPVLRGLAQVPHRGVFPDLRPALLVVRGQQALVNADRSEAGLHALLVERIDALLVVQPPVRTLLGEEDRIADGVALPAVGLESSRCSGRPRRASHRSWAG